MRHDHWLRQNVADLLCWVGLCAFALAIGWVILDVFSWDMNRKSVECNDVSPIGTECVRQIGHDGRHKAMSSYAGVESWTSAADWLPPGAGK